MVFGFVMIWIAIQFWFIFDFWQINPIYSLVLCFISFTLTLLWLPESPYYLFSVKKFEECKNVLEKISLTNLGKKIRFEFRPENSSEDDNPTIDEI